MKSYIGIDLGTSGVKLLLVDGAGRVLASHTETYPISYPHPGWSEQAPEDWLAAVGRGMPALLDGQDRSAVSGLSFGGQMHGAVVLDERGEVIRPCILWNDGRTEKETAYLNETIGKELLSSRTANIAFAGFTAPKLLWLRENEPENFARIRKIMLPKDFLAYRLTGTFSSDFSDAAGTLLLDVENKRWNKDMLSVCGIREEQLPRLFESYEGIGRLKAEYARAWGIPDVVVAAGAGDNAAAAVGTGTVSHGDCNISLGTSGTVFISQDTFSVDAKNALHSFCHANGKFHLMGCILSAASCNAWWMNVLKSEDFAKEQAGAEEFLGKNRVWFLPYLMGERSPHNDVNARGAFLGLDPTTTRTQMTLAVLEGVAFALRDCLEVARENGVESRSTRVCGGGAKSSLWCKVLADVCGIPVQKVETEEGPSYGAAILSMVADGAFPDVCTAANALVHVKETVYPDEQTKRAYDGRYGVFKALYPALKESFRKMNEQ